MSLTPEWASCAASSTGTEPLLHPLSFGGANEAVVCGAVVSILSARERPCSTLPAPSRERYSRVRAPSPLTVNGMLYAVQAPPSTRYSVAATPLPFSSSTAVRVTSTGAAVYQPSLPFGSAGFCFAVVVGAVWSAGPPPTL